MNCSLPLSKVAQALCIQKSLRVNSTRVSGSCITSHSACDFLAFLNETRIRPWKKADLKTQKRQYFHEDFCLKTYFLVPLEFNLNVIINPYL